MEPHDREIGMEELKHHTAEVMRRVSAGETITITRRHEPIALLVPARGRSEVDVLHDLARAGKIAWSGGKPKGCKNPPRVRGASVSDAVVEDRR